MRDGASWLVETDPALLAGVEARALRPKAPDLLVPILPNGWFCHLPWRRSVGELSWKVAGIGDFNGDGKADVIWRTKLSSENAIGFSRNASKNEFLAPVPEQVGSLLADKKPGSRASSRW